MTRSALWAIAGVLTVGCLLLWMVGRSRTSHGRTISINATDEVSATADTAVVSVGFESYGRERGMTYAAAADRSNAIVAALLGVGVPKAAIESTDQGLEPISPDYDDSTRYKQGQRYEFKQSWRVTVPAEQAAKVLQTAIGAGANESGSIDWQFKDTDKLEGEAARKALQHARTVASTMASGLGVTLGPLVYAGNGAPSSDVVMGDAEQSPVVPAPRMVAKVTRPLALSSQQITRSSTIYAVFAIQ